MRYDSEERLQLWKSTGRFPDIHDDIFACIETEAMGDSFLDLCCSIGLLGQRIISAGHKCIGVEMDEKTSGLGKSYGVTLPITNMKITVETFDMLGALMLEHGVNVLVARRCFSEIFANERERKEAPRFAQMLLDVGIKEVFLQGRQYTKNASHPLPSIHEEVAQLASHWKPQFIHGEVSYLLPKK
jgi:hypothetical protein